METISLPTPGLSAYGYLKLMVRTAIASLTATILIILLLFQDRVAIGWLMFLDVEVQILFVTLLGILFVANFLSMLAISLDE